LPFKEYENNHSLHICSPSCMFTKLNSLIFIGFLYIYCAMFTRYLWGFHRCIITYIAGRLSAVL
jgi:hypothetical protein